MAQKKKGESLPPGYLAVSRKFFEHSFWGEKRTFSRAEAWVDLLQSAWWGEKPAERIIGGALIRHARGELIASIRFLEQRWQWSMSAVRRFLDLLERENMITRRSEFNQTIITLVNYETYNGGASNSLTQGVSKKEQKSGTPNGTPSDTGTGTPSGTLATHPRHKREEDIKKNKEEGDIGSGETPPSPEPGEIRFLEFQTWVSKNAPTVNKLPEPFTREEYDRIRDKFPREIVQEVILSMHNKADLLKKYRSANLTCQNWCNRRVKDQRPGGAKSTSSAADLIREAQLKQTA